jgi:predicted CXXCH cytochrome family protein
MPRAVAMMLLSLAFLTYATAGAQDKRRSAGGTAAGSHPPVVSTGPAACTSCHAPVMAHRVMHGPAAIGECTACHSVVETNGRRVVTLVGGAQPGNTRQLCVSCHDDVGARLKAAHLHAPVASGDCTSCHDPHGSAFRFQLAAGGNDACLTCHEDVAETMKQPVQHGPAVASCTMCHDAHASTHGSQLRGSANAVCLACHGESRGESVVHDPASIFGTKLTPAHLPLIAGAPPVRLDDARRSGHPTARHPVEGPADPARKGSPFTCASCHNPHATPARNLLRFGATGTSLLCIRCHQY